MDTSAQVLLSFSGAYYESTGSQYDENVPMSPEYAKDLIADIATLENKSKGDISATVTQFLHYRIGGSGNIQLWGNPANLVDTGSDGDGILIQH